MDTPKIINSLEWCFGYGGLHLGLKRILPSLRIIAASEIEAYAVANLVAKIESGQLDAFPIWTNLKTFPCEEFYGLVDIFGAGYPCQPFSSAGRRNGADDPRHLWPFVRRAVEIIRPRYCFFENVEGHISLGLREVITELALLGYRVENSRGEPTWGVFSAAEVGAPHNRKRVFILAERNDQPMGGYLREQIERVNAKGFFDFIARTSVGDGQAISNGERHVHGKPEIHAAERRFDAQRDVAANRVEDLENNPDCGRGEIHKQSAGGPTEHADGSSERMADASIQSDTTGCGNNATGGRQSDLTRSVLESAWPTPRTSDHKGVSPEIRKDGKSRLDQLQNCVHYTGQPSSPDPDKGNTNGNRQGSLALNADWVEALMDVPAMWTACDYLETESTP